MTDPSEDEDRNEDDEERQLFREAVRGVKPLRVHGQPPRAPRARPHARFARADRAAVLRESLEPHGADPEQLSGEALSFHRPHVSGAVLRRLRRGEFRVQREIDLHGMTVAEAKAALREFLVRALEQQLRCVRIVHGKGLRSGHRGPVLKAAVSGILRRTGAVLAYVSARPVDGGTGAVYVLLSCE
ncbi:MAG TPA: Smr/MutS family protein [Steroidobacteraceae bacterium]|nr:Smr/MutS family protein [Steroidobacteraceae bacterium]